MSTCNNTTMWFFQNHIVLCLVNFDEHRKEGTMPRTWKSLFVVPFLFVLFVPYAFGQTTNLDVIPLSWNPPYTASQTDISIFITGDNPNASWTISSNAAWLTLSAPNGSGNSSVTAFVTTSSDTLSRTG